MNEQLCTELLTKFKGLTKARLKAMIIQDELHVYGSLEGCLKLYLNKLEEDRNQEGVQLYPSIQPGKWIYVEPLHLN